MRDALKKMADSGPPLFVTHQRFFRVGGSDREKGSRSSARFNRDFYMSAAPRQRSDGQGLKWILSGVLPLLYLVE